MQRSNRNVFEILNENIDDPETPEVNQRITRWIGTIPSPHRHSSPEDSTPPYRHRLRPKPRLPLSTIQVQAQQQTVPLNQKRKQDTMDRPSKNSQGSNPHKNPRGRKPSNKEQEQCVEEREKVQVHKRGVPILGQNQSKSKNTKRNVEATSGIAERLGKIETQRQRLPRKAKDNQVYKDVDAQDEFSDLQAGSPAEEIVQPKDSGLRRQAGQSTTSSNKAPSSMAHLPSGSLGKPESASAHPSQDSTASRSVTSKESLALMRPPIFFITTSYIKQPGMNMPPLAHVLLTRYISPARTSLAFIPSTLQGHLNDLSNTPSGRYPMIPAENFRTPAKADPTQPEQTTMSQSELFDWHPVDQELIREQVFDIQKQGDIWRDKCDEDFWIDIVVSPLMHLVRRMTQFHWERNKNDVPRLSVCNLKSKLIKPDSLISTSDAVLFKALNKKIDMGIGLNLFQFRQDDLQSRNYKVEPAIPTVNQTQSCFNFTPFFINAEVKRKHQNKDPLIQLGAWVAAEFNKRYREGWPLDMPVVAIAIEGDEWLLYIVHHISGHGDEATSHPFKLRFVGPIPIGSTTDYQGMFRILFVLCTLGNWGEQVYRPWFYGVHNLKDQYEG